MRIRIRVHVDPKPAPDALFANVFLPAHRSWGAPVGSVCLHIALIAVIPYAFQLLTPVPDFQWNKFDVKPIDVRIPLYFTAPAPERVERPRAVMAKGEQAAAEPATETASQTAAPAHLELPPLPARKKAETVLLQPNVPMPNIQLSQMPALAFWARQSPTLAPPVPKPFVSPGRTEQPAAAAAPLDAPPVLAVPNRQTRLSDVNIADLPAARAVKLPVQPSSTAPVRVPKAFKPPEAQHAGTIDAGSGDPTNIIAFGAVPVPDKIVTVPPVSQAPSLGTDAAMKLDRPAAPKTPAGADAAGSKASSTQTGSGPRDEHAAKTGNSSGGNKNATDGSGSGGDKGKENAKEVAKDNASDNTKDTMRAAATQAKVTDAPPVPQATVEPRQVTSRANGTGTGPTGTPLAVSSPVQQAVLAEAAKTRPAAAETQGNRLTQPRDGRFAFVVSGSSESYPETRGALGGKVVYSVSVRVGAPKAWVMQYCLPAADERSLGLRATSVPLEAPYPFVMIRPAITSPLDVRRLVVHGFVNLAGRLEQLSLVSDVEFPEKQALLASLAQWEFRPASRDGQATAVEILLIIPREAV